MKHTEALEKELEEIKGHLSQEVALTTNCKAQLQKLEEYARHKPNCQLNELKLNRLMPNSVKCSCGFKELDELLKESK